MRGISLILSTRIDMRTFLLFLSTAAIVSAQVRFSPEDVAINIDGKPFTVFHYGTDAAKPYLSPLRSASGRIVTRHFPMDYIETESHDHLHHRGLWFSYDDVNGVKFWENDPSYTKPNMGRQVVTGTKWKDGDKSGTLTATIEWRDTKGVVLIVETREITVYSDPKLRTLDFRSTLTAAVLVTFGDTKEGAFAIRLADTFTEKKGGQMVDADGRATMARVWGKRSNWVDYTGDVDGEKLGVAIFDAATNPRHPTYWHARDYGLFALNPFGQNAFDPKLEASKWKLPKGDKLTFLWRVVIHPGNAESAHIADLYKAFVK
jgi:hypothetical protein